MADPASPGRAGAVGGGGEVPLALVAEKPAPTPVPKAVPVDAARLDALDALRGLAALYTVLHHYVRENLGEAFPWLARGFVFGQAAVMLFFLLSGFVVWYASAGTRPDFTARWYLVRRFRRIYPPFLVALVVSWACVGLAHGVWTVSPSELLGNLLLLQDKALHPGAWVRPFEGNHPLWSLAYEWSFYLMFLGVWLASGRRPERLRYLVAGLASAAFALYLAVPSQLALFVVYFPIWWCGVELAREWLETGTVTVRRQAFPVGVVAAFTVVWAAVAAGVLPGATGAGPYAYPGLQLRQFATSLGLLGVGWAWWRLGTPGWDRLVRPFVAVAPISYALYVLHQPLLSAAAALRLTPSGLLDALWLGPLLWALSWWVEGPLQRRVNAVLR